MFLGHSITTFHFFPLSSLLTFFLLHSSLFTLHSSLFTLHSSLSSSFTLHSSLFTLHSSLSSSFTLHSSLFTFLPLHSSLFILHSSLSSPSLHFFKLPSISAVILSRSNSGFQPQSLLATVSSML